MRTFTLGMHGLGVSTSPDVAQAFDLSAFRVMADLGAATGHLVIAACEAWPELRGIVFDMEKVIPVAREFVGKSTARERIEVRAGDFFLDELPAIVRHIKDAPRYMQTILEERDPGMPTGFA